ncbi:tripartite tricarboxylate transporter substrate binding protein [Aquabacter sp. CN5-332]|uniref:Bug family tripartite tricarboxylate transporter substrate binding protein n=1 Tax=Aquabacter sp. CN5-332 TaxID=3156608 RepID=UPI0032B461C2
MGRPKLTRALKAAVFACGAMVLSLPALAQGAFPDRPITLVVGFSPGGSNDVTARVVAPELSKLLKVPVVVENRVGAAGTIATSYVGKSNPDGYTLLVASASPLVLSPHTNDSIPYDALKDFIGISLIGITPEVLALYPGVPAKNLKELVALAKTRDINLASSGSGGLPHLAIELFKSAAPGARIVHVPYKGAAPAVTDVVAGHVDGVVVDLPAVQTFIKTGRLRGIATANDRRSEFLPDLPTSGEEGLPSFIAVNWIALVAPAKTPTPVVDKLRSALFDVMKLPSVKEALAQAGVEVQLSKDSADFQTFLVSEYEKWGKVAKAANVKAGD